MSTMYSVRLVCTFAEATSTNSLALNIELFNQDFFNIELSLFLIFTTYLYDEIQTNICLYMVNLIFEKLTHLLKFSCIDSKSRLALKFVSSLIK